MNRTFVGPLPPRIRALPVDHRGFPIPYFVAYQDGKPYFPAADALKQRACMRNNLCWICGQPLGAFKAFCIGPMCCVNKISAEPPQHLGCARFAVRNCPFMAQPLAKRVKVDPAEFDKPGGVFIERNPGVTAIWVTKSFSIINDNGSPLWRLGKPTEVSFWARGREATRAEVQASVETGLPILFKEAGKEGPKSIADLVKQVDQFNDLLDDMVQWPLPDIDLRDLEVPDEPTNFGNPDWPQVKP